jgi:hypothetical protein
VYGPCGGLQNRDGGPSGPVLLLVVDDLEVLEGVVEQVGALCR